MKKFVLVAGLLAGCSPRSEFPAETVQAYQSDGNLRASTLQKCADHVTGHTPFATQSDTEECQKAAEAQGSVISAAHLQREREGNERVLQEINSLTAGSYPAKQ
jgi:hypothetical protein